MASIDHTLSLRFRPRPAGPDSLRHLESRSAAGVPAPVPVAARLLHYLADRAGSASLHYLHELVPVSDGWETYIYHFQLQGVDGLPREFRGPLTLRLFAGRRGIPQGRH